MRRVRAEHHGPVAPGLADRRLAGERAERKSLPRALEGVGVRSRREGLRHAEGDQDNGEDNGEGQQHIEHRADEIGPEVADRLTAIGAKRPRHGAGDGEARPGGDKILDRETPQLAEEAHRRPGAVGLPGGLCHETDRRIESEIGAETSRAIRTQRQDALQPQKAIEEDETGGVQRQERDRILEPALAAPRLDATQPIEQALDRPHRGIKPGRRAGPDRVQIGAKRPSAHHGQCDSEQDFGCSGRGHDDHPPVDQRTGETILKQSL